MFELSIFNELKTLLHFDAELSVEIPPAAIVVFRQKIEATEGVLVRTPEYVFSFLSGLKIAVAGLTVFDWMLKSNWFGCSYF